MLNSFEGVEESQREGKTDTSETCLVAGITNEEYYAEAVDLKYREA